MLKQQTIPIVLVIIECPCVKAADYPYCSCNHRVTILFTDYRVYFYMMKIYQIYNKFRVRVESVWYSFVVAWHYIQEQIPCPFSVPGVQYTSIYGTLHPESIVNYTL